MVLAASGLILHNMTAASRAGEMSASVVEQMVVLQNEYADDAFRDAHRKFYSSNPDAGMSSVEIDGIAYVGILELPAAGIRLPVAADCSKKQLKTSPCRYKGSVYSNDLIIAGHNYRSHLGKLKLLGPGDEICFTDADGNRFDYEIVSVEDISGTDVERMKSGNWDITVFTCTASGKSRFTIRGKLL